MSAFRVSAATCFLAAAVILITSASASAASALSAFAAPPPALTGRARSICSVDKSSFVQGMQVVAEEQVSQRSSGSSLSLLRMGKVSAFGPFTPAVVALRSVVGEKKFNQIRGKVITEFCVYAGVDRNLRQGLIRLAKSNGNILGFLS